MFAILLVLWAGLRASVRANIWLQSTVAASVSTAEEYVQAIGEGAENIVINGHLDLRNVTVEAARAARTALRLSTSSIRV